MNDRSPEQDLDALLAEFGEFLGVDDVVSLLNVSRPTVVRLLDDETDPVPHYRVGRLIRIPKRDFRDWLLRHRKG